MAGFKKYRMGRPFLILKLPNRSAGLQLCAQWQPRLPQIHCLSPCPATASLARMEPCQAIEADLLSNDCCWIWKLKICQQNKRTSASFAVAGSPFSIQNYCFFFLTIATVHLETQISFSSSSTILISQTIVVLPLCSGVPIAVTSPSCLPRR